MKMSIAKTKHVILHDQTIVAKKVATVRLDPDLYDAIKEYAKLEHRSINGQIIEFIVEGIACREITAVSEFGHE